MSHDFETTHDRRGTDSLKWQKYAGSDILPMWVADMDFQTSPAIVEALRRRVAHGIFGYAHATADETAAVVEAMQARYGWAILPEWIVWLPGLVCGLNVTAQAFADPGDQILCNTPIYPPFMTAATNSGRRSLAVPLALNSAARRWEIDFDAMERAVVAGNGSVKIFLLCNPHNPVARVFRREELLRLAEFCLRHKIVLCSDEIHCDLVLDPALPHIPAATLAPEIAARAITLMAPSKTYNIPGLCTSFAIISNPTLRATFQRAAAGIVAEVNALGYAACAAAYRDSEPWRQELLACLRGNRDRVREFVASELPGVTIEAPHEATYLAWLNVSALKLENPVAHFEKHGVGLSDGADFGSPRGAHVRLNFGCPRATLDEALRRMKAAL
ncbi:cystathionine beta-lyase [Ereboglobus sp. PH5-5]|uniref:MalY/PatB family protein n=1 Tax=Ereboglobus sp. PH5-5 TaxID=2940529 RepID=UPI0024069F24|nr:PatB family C-S lyase [Ereboglobus sp. PH5-5]MDF9833352.1 cystathionine beta-lyase [Ereboglobus sp. PH5-5]